MTTGDIDFVACCWSVFSKEIKIAGLAGRCDSESLYHDRLSADVPRRMTSAPWEDRCLSFDSLASDEPACACLWNTPLIVDPDGEFTKMLDSSQDFPWSRNGATLTAELGEHVLSALGALWCMEYCQVRIESMVVYVEYRRTRSDKWMRLRSNVNSNTGTKRLDRCKFRSTDWTVQNALGWGKQLQSLVATCDEGELCSKNKSVFQ
jgi:hypothetical protein